MAMGLSAVGGLFMLSLQQTPLGRAMWAVRDTELAARSVGVRPAAVKLIAFVIGAIYAAIAGWMFAYHAFAVTPGHFTLFSNVFLLLAIVIGGRHSLLGVWLGALYLVVVPELVRNLGSGNLYPVISGLLLIFVVLLAPRGFADLLAKLAKRLRQALVPAIDSKLASDRQPHRVGLGLQKRETTNSSSSTSLRVKDVSVNFAGITALTRVTAEFPRGVSGLIGPNGAGKTTLLNVMTGYVRSNEGQVELDDEVLTGLTADQLSRRGIVRSFQTVRLMDGETVLTNILLGRYRIASRWSLAQACGLPKLRTREHEDRAAATEMALLLGLDLSDLNRPTSELPFGARRLVEIGRVLVSRPPVVLLDEPTSGLTRLERNHLATFLRKYVSERPIIMILTEHDVDLVRQLCERLVVLDSGAIIGTGLPKDVLADARVKQAYFGSTG
jgi:ABC-type branched-subunit amino acid transport system ATPase component